ncbi:hypothetical protein [Nocardioides sp. YIM 152588]|uniref:hypothetical protein n=1 Tax=Nocardioides sp. YIM 152588 TaxID=3158259 RepID=UPI0032E3BDE5
MLGLFALVLALGLPTQASTQASSEAAQASAAAAGPKTIKVFGAVKSNTINDFTEPAFVPLVTKRFRTAKGYLAITGTVGTEDDASLAGAGKLRYQLKVDGKFVLSNGAGYEITHTDAGSASAWAGAITAVVPVKARFHKVQLMAREQGTGTFIYTRELSIVYTPQGSGKAIPARTVAPRGVNR